jgi:3-phosphoshikimate 1-carboxyvinyltransferase
MQPLQLRLPGDFSSSAFLIVAALVTPDSEITLKGVGLNPTRTGLLEALEAMGAQIRLNPEGERQAQLGQAEPVGDVQVRYSPLEATQVSGDLVVKMIDEFPAFAVAAAFAAGRTVVQDAEELRHKESDRISALCEQLRQLEIDAQETPDGFWITGGIPHGGLLDSCGDHRLAMALAVAGLAAQSPVTINAAEIISESFPGFVDILHRLGADVHQL